MAFSTLEDKEDRAPTSRRHISSAAVHVLKATNVKTRLGQAFRRQILHAKQLKALKKAHCRAILLTATLSCLLTGVILASCVATYFAYCGPGTACALMHNDD